MQAIQDRRALVTGANGFIGAHLTRALVAAGCSVRGLVHREKAVTRELRDLGVEVVVGDLRRPAELEAAVRDRELVFHAAGLVTDWAPETAFREVQVEGMRNLCRVALEAGVERLVYISTNDVFGRREDIVLEESLDYEPWGEPYPDSKLAASRVGWEFHDRGLPVSMVYPCWVYGSGDRAFVPVLADAIRTGIMVRWRRGARVWPCSVENLVDLVLLLAVHPAASGEGFLVHDGESDTLAGFCARIARALGVRGRFPRIPYALAYLLGWLNQGVWRLLGIASRPQLTTYAVKNLGSRLRFSIAKAERLLGWTPPHAYPEAFERTLEALR